MHTAIQEEVQSMVSNQTEEMDSMDEEASPQHVMLHSRSSYSFADFAKRNRTNLLRSEYWNTCTKEMQALGANLGFRLTQQGVMPSPSCRRSITSVAIQEHGCER
jgi:hypothetical protein